MCVVVLAQTLLLLARRRAADRKIVFLLASWALCGNGQRKGNTDIS